MRKKRALLNLSILVDATKNALFYLTPKVQIRNPVMFLTYVGAIITSCYALYQILHHQFSFFNLQISLWLWFTVIFANFAYAIAEAKGKAQALFLRRSQKQMQAKRVKGLDDRKYEMVSAVELREGDLILSEAGDTIAADGEVVEGIASVDESAITGESAPVIRESGGDRSAVTGGTKVVSDHLVIRVTAISGKSFMDRIILLVEGAKRQKTPNEIALNIFISSISLLFLFTVFSLQCFSAYLEKEADQDLLSIVTVPVLISLLVCLIPTTIASLLNAIGIAGMDRLIRFNVIAKSGHSVEAAGDIDLLILDKTGTITLGNRQVSDLYPVDGIMSEEFASIAQMASMSDETPEGRSIVVFVKDRYGMRPEIANHRKSKFIPFSARTKMSGVDFFDESGNLVQSIRKGSKEAIENYVVRSGGKISREAEERADKISKQGGTPLLVADGNRVVGVVYLKDVLKGGIKERLSKLRKMGIRTLMVTGDNPLTAASIAAEAGVDDYLALATPEKKMELIKEEQAKGHFVAMAGDGTNDAPALAQADVGVAMNTGTQASREAGNMVDLDSNPTKLIEIVQIGKQLLITRGALTTFSIANDVAKYFAILPALFGGLYAQEGEGPLDLLNIMGLSSPKSAILSAVIFNALIILSLIPLALKGAPWRPASGNRLLRDHLLIYGVGGLLAPFIGIKVIDMVITMMGWAS